MKRAVAAMIALLCILTLCTGCTFQTGEELYSLPQPPDEYLELQSVIENVLSAGAEYSAPTSGSNRQSVQLKDIDGDGTEEAIAFLKNTGDTKPLKVYIFRMKDDVYTTQAVIEGDGSSIDSINYVDLNGDGSLEILIGWKVSEDVIKALSVYTLRSDGAEELVTVNYSKYTVGDIDGDSDYEVVAMRMGDDKQAAVAECLDCSGGKVESLKVSLSMGISSIAKVSFGPLQDGTQSLYVTSLMENTNNVSDSTLVTDILVKTGGRLKNVTVDPESSVSTNTLRNYVVYASDVENDGVMEIPKTETFHGNENTSEMPLKITWYSIDGNANMTKKAVTCSDYADGWYILLPDSWHDTLTVSRTESASGQAVVTLGRSGAGGAALPLIKIYCYPKENLKRTQGTQIASTGTMTYTYELTDNYAMWQNAVSEEKLAGMFHTVEPVWASGNIW